MNQQLRHYGGEDEMKTTTITTWWAKLAVGLALLCLAVPARGQNPRLNLERLEKLSSKAVEVTNVTLDGDMLQLAAKFLDMDHEDEDAAQAKQIVKKLKGIYVKSFEFEERNQYSAADVEEIRAQLAAPGWNKIVESRSKRNNENDEIYFFKDANNNIGGIAVLVAEPKELTVVNIVGPVDMDKLSALSGKFGIPADKEKEKEKHKDRGKSKQKDNSGKNSSPEDSDDEA